MLLPKISWPLAEGKPVQRLVNQASFLESVQNKKKHATGAAPGLGSADDEVLQSLGYEPQLTRDLTTFNLFGELHHSCPPA